MTLEAYSGPKETEKSQMTKTDITLPIVDSKVHVPGGDQAGIP